MQNARVPPGHSTPTTVAHTGHRHVIVSVRSSSSLLYKDSYKGLRNLSYTPPTLQCLSCPQGLAQTVTEDSAWSRG